MNYWLYTNPDTPVEGPFSLEELNARRLAGLVPSGALYKTDGPGAQWREISSLPWKDPDAPSAKRPPPSAPSASRPVAALPDPASPAVAAAPDAAPSDPWTPTAIILAFLSVIFMTIGFTMDTSVQLDLPRESKYTSTPGRIENLGKLQTRALLCELGFACLISTFIAAHAAGRKS